MKYPTTEELLNYLQKLNMEKDNPEEQLEEFWMGYNEALHDALLIVGWKHESYDCGNHHCQMKPKYEHCLVCELLELPYDGYPCQFAEQKEV